MPRGRTWRWLIPAVALLACAGVWLGHTLEYARVWGWSGLDRELNGSLHLYMVPAGLGLTLLLAAVAVTVARLHLLLTRRAERASNLLARAWRAGPVAAKRTRPSSRAQPLSPARAVLALGAVLTILQTGLYVIQENVESAVARLRAPGLSVITGMHWAAPVIHLAVAFVLAAVTVALWLLFRRREAHIERVERAVRGVLLALAARRVRPLLAPPAPVLLRGAPALLGTAIWCRPPPAALIP